MAPKFFLRVQAKLKITDFGSGVVVGFVIALLVEFVLYCLGLVCFPVD